MGAISKVEAAIVDMLREQSKVFYTSLLLQMIRIEDENCMSVGVTVDKGKILLIINPKIVELITLKELIAIMEHECLHLVFEHPLRCKDKSQTVWNISCDMAINQMIQGLPKWAVFPEQFNFPEDKHAEFYYELLKRNIKQYKITIKPICCPQEALSDNGQGKGQGDFEIEIGTPNGKKKVVDSHKGWEEMSNGVSNELKKEIIKQAIKQAYEETQKNRGYVPGNVEEAIKEWLKPPTISWKQLLRMFVGNSVKAASKHSWKRISRRFGENQKGHLPVRILKCVLAIDTSGSIRSRDFIEFISEIKSIMACYKNETTVIECDAEIQKIYKLKPYSKIGAKFKGRGGTAYEPVLEYIEKHNLKHDLLIYFTDLYCTYPKERPPYEVLWVCSSQGNLSNKPPWGILIQIKNLKT